MTTITTSTDIEYWYNAIVLSIHDGDTMTLKIDMGRRIHIEDSIRLYRINTPELSEVGGKEAREFLRQLCPVGLSVRVRTYKNKNDKYGRWLGDVWLTHRDKELCVNDYMVTTGHAKYTTY